ncbi:VanW family protein [Streptomyces sp. NPDC048603]|uniref:VanW family protein n=1 Tax=Streptomyces sp. NPDC048603 TaxID=3365577 RepID=UPI003720E778
MRRVHRWKGNWRMALPLVGGAAVLGVGGLYATGLIMGGDTIAEGTRVRGVDIGGMSRAEAETALHRGLGTAATAPMSLRVGDRVERMSPASFGLSFDAEATVDRAAGPSGSGPFDVIGRVVAPKKGGEVEPVVRMDEAASATAVKRLSAAGQPVRDGAVSFENGTARATSPVTGVALRADRAADAVRAAYLRPQAAATPVELPVLRTAPAVGAQETERAMREFAEPAMSAPVTLTVDGKSISLTPTVLGRHLKVEADDRGRLVPELDSEGLLADGAVARQVAAASTEPRNATFRVDSADRAVVATDARTGLRVDEQAIGGAVMPLLTGSDTAARTGELPATRVQPKLTAEEAQRLGIKEKVSSFTVQFPSAPYRTTNVGRAVDLIDGSLVLPGQTWSFNDTVGERTEENGFVDGIMINDGQYVKSPGGGVSAVATTMYNAAFFAGVKPVEHGAHSFYIERYPEGREATVAWGTLDLRWRNDTGHALYVRAQSTDTSVTISLLGTKKYDEIRATQGPRTNVVPPAKRTGTGPTCEVQTPLEGFDVSVDRVFVNGGKEVGRETYETHYTPRDEVVCEPEASAAPPSPSAGATGTPGAPVAPASATDSATDTDSTAVERG